MQNSRSRPRVCDVPMRRTFTMHLIGAAVCSLLLSACVTVSSPTPEGQEADSGASERLEAQVDDSHFPQLRWRQQRSEVVAILGEPTSTDMSSPDSIPLWFGSREVFGYLSGILAGFDPITDELHSVQAFLVYEPEDPDAYLEAYGFIETRLDEQYGPSNRFDWYSPKAQPAFTGMEMLRKELAFISHRVIGRSILVHTMMYADEHINHAVGFYDSTVQDVETTLEIFAASYANSLR